MYARQPTAYMPPVSRPALFFGVPLCSYQYTGTFTPQSGAPHGQHESDCNHWFWEIVATQMKTARRAYPRERLPFGSHTSIRKPPRRTGQCAAARTAASLYAARLARAGCLPRGSL